LEAELQGAAAHIFADRLSGRARRALPVNYGHFVESNWRDSQIREKAEDTRNREREG
jgi:hypothetical protein